MMLLLPRSAAARAPRRIRIPRFGTPCPRHAARRGAPRTGRGTNGFTLVELMVVIVILGLLATIVVINVMPAVGSGGRRPRRGPISPRSSRASRSTSSTTAATRPPRRGCRRWSRARSGRLPNDPWDRPYRLCVRRGGTAALFDQPRWARTGARAARGRMKISPTEPSFWSSVRDGEALAIEEAASRRRRSRDGGSSRRAGRCSVVPGERVAIHWLDLAEDLTPAQAAAAARLMLADASAAPLADMHVAVGRPEDGLTPVALAPVADMAEWTEVGPGYRHPVQPAASAARGRAGPARARPSRARAGVQHRAGAGRAAGRGRADPGAGGGRVRGRAARGARRAGAEPAAGRLRQAAAMAGRQAQAAADRPVRRGAGGAQPGPAARRRSCATISPPTGLRPRRRRLAASGPAARPAFGALAAILFESVRATPNAELGRIEYRARWRPRRDPLRRQPGDARRLPPARRGERAWRSRAARSPMPAGGRPPSWC